MSKSENDKNNSTSIEIVSKDGPIPIDVMMQEGVKALTRILSDHLQDGNKAEDLYQDQHSMQLVFKNNGSESNETKAMSSLPDTVIDQEEQIVELDNESNYHIHEVHSTDMQEEDVPDPELHLDAEDGEIVFDYGAELIDDSPRRVTQRISQMIESVLPEGFVAETKGRLHAVMNGDELNITEEEEILRNYKRAVDKKASLYASQLQKDNGKKKQPTQSNAEEDSSSSYHHHDANCPHHGHGHGQQHPRQAGASMYKNYNYHDYEYAASSTKQLPDFSVLMNEKNSMCMFCEYYMVFGEPPKNMIKWYNQAYGYDRLPPPIPKQQQQQQQQHQNRKRNR